MAKVYKRHEFVKEVYEACVAGEARRLETLTESKFTTPGQREEQLPSKWDFQESGEEFSLLGQTPLHVAAEKGFVDVVRVLVQRMHVDLDVADDAGWTALHWASAIRREKDAEASDIVTILLDAGADVGAVTKDKGDSALHFAAANGHLGAVKLLCAKGANVNRINEEDSTPVHVAARRGNTDIIKFLNSNGGDISRRDSAGNTPIHLASAANRLDAMEELVAQSPDSVNLRNAAGNTPSDVAGCEAARDMVKPFKKAVNAVRAAMRFSGFGKLSPGGGGGGGGGGLFRNKSLSAKLMRSPQSTEDNSSSADSSRVTSPLATPGAAAAAAAAAAATPVATTTTTTLDISKMNLGGMGTGSPTTNQSSVPVA